jgi:hypothetical protein
LRAPAQSLRLVAGRLQGVRDVRRDLLDRLDVNERPDHRTRLEPVGKLYRAGGLGEALAVPAVWKLWLSTRLRLGLCNELAVGRVRG